MTPAETWMAIEAAIWQDERQGRRDAILAWRTAALNRMKRMPSLKNYLAQNTPQQVKVLRGDELEQRQAEFRHMSTAVQEAAPALHARLAALQKRNANRKKK